MPGKYDNRLAGASFSVHEAEVDLGERTTPQREPIPRFV
jgi:hypothetical protein